MKTTLLAALTFATLTLANPLPDAAPDTPHLDARATADGTVKVALKCRHGPGTGYPRKMTMYPGYKVRISRQCKGTVVHGNPWWDWVGGEASCWMADHYISTGHVRLPGVPTC